jgi:hypothetical protein
MFSLPPPATPVPPPFPTPWHKLIFSSIIISVALICFLL